MDWYVARDGETFGPFSFERLVEGIRDGELKPEDLVSSSGMPQWQAVREIAGLWSPPSLPDPARSRPAPAALRQEPTAEAKPLAAVEDGNAAGQGPTEDGRAERAAAAEKAGLIRRHWRGELSLARSYWVVGILLSLGLTALGHAVGAILWPLELGTVAEGLVFGTFLIFLCACTVWQLVGVWRSAGNYLKGNGRRVWGGLARLAVVLGALRAGLDFYTVIGPMLLESGRMAARIEDVPTHEFRLLRNGTELELAGGMPQGTAAALRKLLDAAPAVRLLHLNSTGGRVAEGYEIYRLVRDRKLITYTASDCVSACTIAFLGGRQRLLSTRARLGFHSISFGGVDERYIPDINAELRRTLSEHGAPRWFIDKALGTPAHSMWYPAKSELTEAKIVTGVVDPHQFGLSGMKLWQAQEFLEKGLLSLPLYALVRDNDPDTFKSVADRLADGVRRGMSVAEIADDVRALFMGEILAKYMRVASNERVQKYWRTQHAQLVHLSKDPLVCRAYLFPQFQSDDFDIDRLVPERLREENAAALSELVEEAVHRPRQAEPADAKAEIAAVMARVAARLPWAEEILEEPHEFTDQPAALCTAYLAFFGDILALPAAPSAAILRALKDRNP